MNSQKEYSHNSKLKAGPAGWTCPCCNPMRCHPRNMKRLARRLFRRTRKNISADQE